MMSRKQAMKYDLAEIHTAFRTIQEELGGKKPAAKYVSEANDDAGDAEQQPPSASPVVHRKRENNVVNSEAMKRDIVAAGESTAARRKIEDGDAADDEDGESTGNDGIPLDHISTDALMHGLMEYGSEALSEDEARDMIQLLKPDAQDRIDWKEWVQMVFKYN